MSKDALQVAPRWLKQAGFTLVELVVVLVIAAILVGGIVVLFDTEEPIAAGERQALITSLRYTQLLAMGDVQIWGLNINGAQYTLQRNCTAQTVVNIPGANSEVYTVQNGQALFGTVNVVYDTFGQLVDCNGDPLGADLTVTINNAIAPDLDDIVITQETGFIQ